jgi:ketopantoate reductase
VHKSNENISLTVQQVVKSVADISPVDYIVCAHKAIDQDEAVAQLQPAIDDRTTIVVIQNGVGNEEPFRKQFPNNTIITCVVGFLRIVTSTV